ncbi:MAG: cytochrome P450 [Proteobacteria bacterium]|nr:cytochrome P450 [Pseudomonadota bacterium]MBI3500135.1 cytochrome P450 [Pseudomonadota bacterium]
MTLSGAERYGHHGYVGTTLDPKNGPSVAGMRWLTRLADVDDVFRSQDFEQGGGGRRDSGPFVGGSLLSLSGDEHFERRRILSALFRRSMVESFQDDVFAPAFEAALRRCPRGTDGLVRAELQRLIRVPLRRVSAALVGIDGIDRTDAAERYQACVDKMAIGVNLEWVAGDHRRVTDEILPAKERFAAEFFEPSFARRRALVEAVRAGRIERDALPLDLMTLILLHPEHFRRWGTDLPLHEVILVNGAPASIPLGVSHVVSELTEWFAARPEDRALMTEPDFVRRAVFESLRLHPASPFLIRRARRDTRLASGQAFAAGEYVVLDIYTAGRDPEVYGADPERYDPRRAPKLKLRPMGLGFGGGPHTCIGLSLSVGGTSAADDDGPQGIMVWVVSEIYARGVEMDPERPPRFNDVTVRNEYAEFPVIFRKC